MEYEDKIKEQETKDALEFAESIINAVHESLIILDSNLKVVSANNSFYQAFKLKPEDTVGQFIYDIGNHQWNIPKLRELLENILPGTTTFDNYEIKYNFPGIGERVMLLNARQIQRPSGRQNIILLVIEDVTEPKKILDELKDKISKSELFRTAIASKDHMILDLRRTIDELQRRILRKGK